MEDEIKVEETSTEETSDTSSESSTEVKTEEHSVPYERFKEVNSKKRELEQEIKTLKGTEKSGDITPEQQQELKAKQYLKGLLKETLEEEKRESSRKEKEEQEKFESDVDDTLLANPSIKREEFVKFLKEEADELGVSTVSGAMNLFKRLQNMSKETADKTKKDLQAKPNLPKSDSGSKPVDYREADKDKPLHKIVEEAIAEQELKTK